MSNNDLPEIKISALSWKNLLSDEQIINLCANAVERAANEKNPRSGAVEFFVSGYLCGIFLFVGSLMTGWVAPTMHIATFFSLWLLSPLPLAAPAYWLGRRRYKKELEKHQEKIEKIRAIYNIDQIKNLVKNAQWSDPLLADLCDVNGQDLKPLTEKEIEALDERVTNAAIPNALNLWKDFLASPAPIRQGNAKFLMGMIESVEKNRQGSAQEVRQRLLQKHQLGQEFIIVTDEAAPDQHRQEIGEKTETVVNLELEKEVEFEKQQASSLLSSIQKSA